MFKVFVNNLFKHLIIYHALNFFAHIKAIKFNIFKSLIIEHIIRSSSVQELFAMRRFTRILIILHAICMFVSFPDL